MSAGSNRALYTAAADRAAYNSSGGRALYAQPAIIGTSEYVRFTGYEVKFSTYSQADYEQAKADADTEMAADTGLDTDNQSDYYQKGAMAYGAIDRNIDNATKNRAKGFVYATRNRFIVSAISMANIKRFIISANCGAGKANHWVDGGDQNSCEFDDFGGSINFFISQSATEFASGADLIAATPDQTFTFADINAAHVAASRALTAEHSYSYGFFLYPPVITMECSSMVSKLNGFDDNTYFYLWTWISGEETFPYLYKGFNYDFSVCALRFHTPSAYFLD